MRFAEQNRPCDIARREREKLDLEQHTQRGRNALARLLGEAHADQLIAGSLTREQNADPVFALRPPHEQRFEVVTGLCRARGIDAA